MRLRCKEIVGEEGMAHRKLEFCTRLTREDVAGLIEALVEGLKDGVLKVQKSGETLELEVPRVVDLEIEAEIDDERAEFEIEVSWRTNRAENPDVAPGGTKKQSSAARPPAASKGRAAAKKPAEVVKKSPPAKKTTKSETGAKAKASGSAGKTPKPVS